MIVSNEIRYIFSVFGTTLIIALISLIIYQYLNARHQLMTYRNALLGGCIIFIGMSTLGLGISGIAYSRVTPDQAWRFITYATLFVTTFLIAYSQLPGSNSYRKLLNRKSLYSESHVLLPLVILATAFSIWNFTGARLFYIPFVSELLRSISNASIAFAVLFAIALLRRNPLNLAVIGLVISVIGTCLVLSVMAGSGRRSFLSVLIAICVYIYWIRGISFSPGQRFRNMFRVGVALFVTLVLISAYNKARHFDLIGKNRNKARSVSRSVDAIKRIPDLIQDLPDEIASGQFVSATGQDATKCSLLMMKLESSGPGSNRRLNMHFPFYSLYFAASNPIPRKIWKDKPLALGYLLPIVGLRISGVNLGPGIVGHAVHEGGIVFVFFYALVFAFITRGADDALQAAPSDLLRLSLYASVFPNILALIRGDLGVVLVTLIFSLIAYVFYTKIASTLELNLLDPKARCATA